MGEARAREGTGAEVGGFGACAGEERGGGSVMDVEKD